jgi:uncharacterized protein HemX
MITDSNDGLASSASSTKRKGNPPKTNLEFDFNGSSSNRASAREEHSPKTIETKNSMNSNSTPSSVASSSRSEERPVSPSQERPRTYTNPQSPSSSSMSNTSFAQFQQNVQRQSREQKAVGSLLSGVAIALIVCILLVAGLAGYGGYILSQQIKQQSATVAQLDNKTDAHFTLVESGLKESATGLDNLNAQIQAQKQQIQSYQNQLEAVRTQSAKDRAAFEARMKKIDGRLYEVERVQDLAK